MRSFFFRSLAVLLPLGLVMISPEAAAAGLTNLTDNILDLSKAAGKIVVAIAFLAGLIGGYIFISTLMNYEKAKQEGGVARKLAISLLVAAVGLGFSTFVVMTSKSVFGDDVETAQSIDESDFGL